jgi:hypothetical protein
MDQNEMKKRIPYIISFFVLLIVEILIGAFVRDDFIRPYGGDILVTVLLCSLWRSVKPEGVPWLPVWVLLFSVLVECFQLIEIPALDGTIWGILLGSTFSVFDLICYAIGCALFAVAEKCMKRGRCLR